MFLYRKLLVILFVFLGFLLLLVRFLLRILLKRLLVGIVIFLGVVLFGIGLLFLYFY